MDKQDALDFIELAVPSADAANKEAIAKGALAKAVAKFGRMKNASWNSKAATKSLTANKGEYDLGVDLLGDVSSWTVYEMWMTDRQGYQIYIVSVDDFNEFKRGSTNTGRPVYATLHSDENKLEFYPTPDSAYDIWIYYRKDVKNFEEIPSLYHDAVVDYAVLCVYALRDASMALQLAGQSFKDTISDSLTQWNGNTITLRNYFTSYPNSVYIKSSDSQNLRGS